MGYDIGCVFQKTISTSSLGTQFTESKSHCCVNVFHGYSHNFSCQTQNHPNVIDGMGIEDLETMERIFNSSNQVASVTRYASAYHCCVFIDMFFQQWDDEKYRNLASMLSNNYHQVISIIRDEGAAVEETMNALGITSTDLETWHYKQASFFETVGEESRWDVHMMAYVELLQELSSTKYNFSPHNQILITNHLTGLRLMPHQHNSSTQFPQIITLISQERIWKGL